MVKVQHEEDNKNNSDKIITVDNEKSKDIDEKNDIKKNTTVSF